MARRQTKSNVIECRYERCPKPERQIVGADLRRAVKLSASMLMHRECHEAMREAVQRVIDEAIAAGTHSERPPHSPPEHPFARAGRLAAGCDFSRALAEQAAQKQQEA